MDGISTIAQYSLKAAENLIPIFKNILTKRTGDDQENEIGSILLDALPENHIHFFCELLTYYNNDGLICSHAGADSKMHLIDTPQKIFTWGGL